MYSGDANLKLLLLCAALVGGIGIGPNAFARDPQPPPSGIVIHLFGRNSVLSNVLSTQPAAEANTAPAIADGSAATSPATSQESAGPTTGQILHQMFITGDPNDPPKPALGRAAERPAE